MRRFDEVHHNGSIRPHYRLLMERLGSLSAEDLTARFTMLESIFRTLGITFAVSGDEAGQERTWPMVGSGPDQPSAGGRAARQDWPRA